MVDEIPHESEKKTFWTELFRKPRPEENYWTRNTQYTLIIGVPIMLTILIVLLIIIY